MNVHVRRSPRCAEWYKELENASTLSPSQSSPVPSRKPEEHATSCFDTLDSPVHWSLLPKARPASAPTQHVLGSRFTSLGRIHDHTSDTVGDDSGGLGDVGGTLDDFNGIAGAQNSPHRVETHPTAGKVFGKARTILEEINYNSSDERKKNIYHPFISSEDFEVGAWLSQSGAPMSQIDKFLKLPYVCII